MTVGDEAKREILLLRQELIDLKRCQLHYFTAAVTGTGAILGIAGSVARDHALAPVLLTPLLIVLPCFVIFFDKATTITRIVGYIRVLEGKISNELPADSLFFGWENSLARYRQYEDGLANGKGPQPRQDWGAHPEDSAARLEGQRQWRLSHLLHFHGRHRYWFATFYIFFGLVTVSCVSAWSLSLSQSPGHDKHLTVLIAASVIALVCVLYALRIVRHLVSGSASYDQTTKVWRIVLDTCDGLDRPRQ